MKTFLIVALLVLFVSSAGAQTPSGWSQSAGASPPPTAGNAAPAGQACNEREPLPPPSLYPSAQTALSPLPPADIRRLRDLQVEVDRAMTSPLVAVVPRIHALTVDLSTGASLPLVRAAIHYFSSLSFIDSTGGAPERASGYQGVLGAGQLGDDDGSAAAVYQRHGHRLSCRAVGSGGAERHQRGA